MEVNNNKNKEKNIIEKSIVYITHEHERQEQDGEIMGYCSLNGINNLKTTFSCYNCPFKSLHYEKCDEDKFVCSFHNSNMKVLSCSLVSKDSKTSEMYKKLDKNEKYKIKEIKIERMIEFAHYNIKLIDYCSFEHDIEDIDSPGNCIDIEYFKENFGNIYDFSDVKELKYGKSLKDYCIIS